MKLWIARDNDGHLFLYETKPERCSENFAPINGYGYWSIDDDLFPEVTFENSPREIILKLKLL